MTAIRQTNKFIARIDIIGINPFVFVPEKILNSIFGQAGKDKGTIPIRGSINHKPFRQTLVKYSGAWRLYINTTMLKDSPKKIGEKIKVLIEYDAEERTTPMHPKLQAALKHNSTAKNVFDSLSPSRQKEIMRYINRLKSETYVETNVEKAIQFLLGKGKFTGRDKL